MIGEADLRKAQRDQIAEAVAAFIAAGGEIKQELIRKTMVTPAYRIKCPERRAAEIEARVKASVARAAKRKAQPAASEPVKKPGSGRRPSPGVCPETGRLRMLGVQERTGLTRHQICHLVKTGRFPRPEKSGTARLAPISWAPEQIEAWVSGTLVLAPRGTAQARKNQELRQTW